MKIKNISGFSLAELMVVVALIGILSAVALPSLLRSLPEQSMKNAARNLYADMQRARMLAVKENKDVHVRFNADENNAANNFYYFDTDDNKSYTAGEFRRNLSEDGDVSFGKGSATKNWNKDDINVTIYNITFSPTGSANQQGSTYIQNKNKDVCYAITTTRHGTVKIRRFDGSDWDQKN